MIIGVDIGTQSLKAIVSDASLRVLGTFAEGYEVHYPKAGWAEQDPMLWERALGRVIQGALTAAQVRADQVRGLGVAGQLDGCIAVGEQGTPLSPCLIWMDRRATDQMQSVDATSVHRLNGIQADAGHMAAKVAWLKQHGGFDPERVRCYHQPVSYLVARLTGRSVMDHALASTTMLYSLEARDYAPELLSQFGIRREELPELAESEHVAGVLTLEGARLTGLPAGVRVAVGTGDDFSSALGEGLLSPGRAVCILGTAEVVGALSPKPSVDARGLLETHPYAGGTYYVENPGWLAGGALTWFKNTFRLNRVEEIEELAASVAPGAEGLLFLPALSGAMAPEWNAHARGCFYGLTASHTLAHMARAVLEGCAFAMRDVLDRLQEMSIPVSSLLLSGGGSHSRLWAQIRADVSGVPVDVSEFKDTSAMGALLLASVACGAQPSLAAAVEGLGQRSTRVIPDPAQREAYLRAYGRYRVLFESLKPMFAHDGRGQ